MYTIFYFTYNIEYLLDKYMIKLKHIILEGSVGISWWLSPTGELQRVNVHRHVPKAVDYFGTIGKDNTNINIYDRMYDLGWLRVALIGYMSQYLLKVNTKYGRRIPTIQMDILKQLAKEHNVTEIIDNTNGHRYPTENVEW